MTPLCINKVKKPFLFAVGLSSYSMIDFVRLLAENEDFLLEKFTWEQETQLYLVFRDFLSENENANAVQNRVQVSTCII